MEENKLSKKEEISRHLGMKFDEVTELFSEETLNSMQMVKYIGKKGEVDLNLQCPSADVSCLNICLNLVCGDCFSDDEGTHTPPDLKWEGCPTLLPPTEPPTMAQDAICWQPTPPLPTGIPS